MRMWHLPDPPERISVPPRAGIRAALRIALVAAGILSGTPSSAAREYRAQDVGGWTVSASQDQQGCFVTRMYQGPGGTTLLLGLDTDGSNRLSVLNANWSIREKERLRLNFRLSKSSFPKHLAIGIASDGKRGFVTSFGETFPASFAASRFLHISRGDVPVEQLDLEGSGMAVAELRKCVDLYRGRPAAKARANGRAADSRIPLDPFAPNAARKARR